MTEYITLPKQAKDIAGQRFGRLVALGPIGRNDKSRVLWECQCDCGNATIVRSTGLCSGNTRSCGCLGREVRSASTKTHGMSGTKIHGIWGAMVQRCTNPKAKNYHDYGGRGITVCDEWRDSFGAFYTHVSQLPNFNLENMTLDRIDNNNGNYEPGNVRWVTRKEQSRNTRRNVLLTYNSKTKTVAEWAKDLGMYPSTLYTRIREGWSVDYALTTPVRRKE